MGGEGGCGSWSLAGRWKVDAGCGRSVRRDGLETGEECGRVSSASTSTSTGDTATVQAIDYEHERGAVIVGLGWGWGLGRVHPDSRRHWITMRLILNLAPCASLSPRDERRATSITVHKGGQRLKRSTSRRRQPRVPSPVRKSDLAIPECEAKEKKCRNVTLGLRKLYTRTCAA